MERLKVILKTGQCLKKLAVNFKCDNGGIITYVGR